MKILVTGATGHLGANLVRRLLPAGPLVRRLLADGQEVRALLRDAGDANDARAVEGLDVERAYGDLRDLDAMRAAVRGVTRVYHTGAKVSTLPGEEQEIYDINVMGTRN